MCCALRSSSARPTCRVNVLVHQSAVHAARPYSSADSLDLGRIPLEIGQSVATKNITFAMPAGSNGFSVRPSMSGICTGAPRAETVSARRPERRHSTRECVWMACHTRARAGWVSGLSTVALAVVKPSEPWVVGPFATDDTGRTADHRAKRGWPTKDHHRTRHLSGSCWWSPSGAWPGGPGGPRVSGTAHGPDRCYPCCPWLVLK